MKQFHEGEWVYWNDPDGSSSGLYRVLDPKKDDNSEVTEQSIAEFDDRIILIGDSYSESEVYAAELTPSPKLRVIFRMPIYDVNPQIYAILLDENTQSTSNNIFCYQSGNKVDNSSLLLCITTSSPVTKKEYAPLLGQMKSAGFKELSVITFDDLRKERINYLVSQLAEHDLMTQYDLLQHQLYDEDGNISTEYADEFTANMEHCNAQFSLLSFK